MWFVTAMSEGKASPLVSSAVVEPVRNAAVHKDFENGRADPTVTHATLNPAQLLPHQSIYNASQPLPSHPHQATTNYMGRTDYADVENFFMEPRDTAGQSGQAGHAVVSVSPNTATLMTYEDSLATLTNAQSGYAAGSAKGSSYYQTAAAADFYKSNNMFSTTSTAPLLSHHYSVTPNR